MTRPLLTLSEIRPPSGIIVTCDAPGRPVEVTLWRGGMLHKEQVSASRAVSLARELLACAAHSGITERTPDE